MSGQPIEERSETYYGLKFLEKYGDPQYKKDIVYCAAVASAPFFLMLIVISQLNWLLPYPVRLSGVGFGMFISIGVASWLVYQPASNLPGILTYPAIKIRKSMVEDYNGGVAFYDSRGTDQNGFVLRVVADGEGWEFKGEKNMWRSPLRTVNKMDIDGDILDETLVEKYNQPSAKATIDLERLESQIIVEQNMWRLKD